MRSQILLLHLCIVRILCSITLINCLSYISVAILSAARVHRNSILSQKTYSRMKSLFPDQKQALMSGSILLSNTYSSVGDQQRSKDVQSIRMKELGKKAKTGLSWSEVNGEIVVKDLF
jgi:hypothetical protein